MNGVRHSRTIAFRRNTRNNNPTLFSIRTAVVFFSLLSISVTAKTLEQEAAFKGRGDSSAKRNTADDPSDAIGALSGDALDRQNALNLLRILSRMDESGSDGRKRRNWMNRESLRVWGKRNDDEDKSSSRGEGGAGSLGSSVHRTSGADDLLMTLKERLADDRRQEHDFSTAYEGDEGKLGSAFPFDIPSGQNDEDNNDGEIRPLEVGSGGLDLTRMPAGALKGLDEKRKWERNALRIWGKRDSASEFSSDFKDRLGYPNVRRRKWENLPLRVWGK